jgi:hypothetical protein
MRSRKKTTKRSSAQEQPEAFLVDKTFRRIFMDLATRVVKQQVVREPSPVGANNPTQIRYGWNPFKEFNLCGPDGTIAIYAQPYQIAGPNGEPVMNPYHRSIPKGQLIPFPTFNIGEQGPSPDLRDSTGGQR